MNAKMKDDTIRRARRRRAGLPLVGQIWLILALLLPTLPVPAVFAEAPAPAVLSEGVDYAAASGVDVSTPQEVSPAAVWDNLKLVGPVVLADEGLEPVQNGCMQDVAGFGLTCTANDVNLASVISLTILDDGCAYPGDTVTFEAVYLVDLTTQERYDVGFYFSTDGDPNGDGAYTGSCLIATLPYAPDPPWLDADGLVDGIQDTCGDIDADHDPLQVPIELTVTCVDFDGDGKLNLPNCTSWRQSGANDLCTTPTDAFPGAPSKCGCDAGFQVPIHVPGQIIVDKVTVPSGRPESFTFDPSWSGADFTLSDDDDPYAKSLDAGTYQVEETVPDGWSLSASCTNDSGTPSDTSDDTTFVYTNGGDLVLDDGETIECTFTNTRDTGSLQIIKTVDAGGSSFTSGSFPVHVVCTGDGGTYDRTIVYPDPGLVVISGIPTLNTCTVTEGTLPDPPDGYVWDAPVIDDPVTIAKDTESQVTVANSLIANTGMLKLVKVVDNLGESGPGYLEPDDFDLTIDGIATASGAWVEVDAGDHTIAEVPQDGYIVGTWSCDDGTTGAAGSASATVSVGGGEDVICTMSNTLIATPGLTIDKTTNGSDSCPTILVGEPVNWSYVVANTGNVALTNVSVTDDQGVAVSCPKTTLAVGESMTCSASGTAVAGDYDNIGTATGYYDGTGYTDSDPGCYFGAGPQIDIQKTPDTQTVASGGTANFTIVVKNTGNVPLSDVAVADPLAPDCAATIGDLDVGAEHSYTCSVDNVTSDFTNVATASGAYDTTTVTDSDDAFVDVLPTITVEKTAATTSVPEPGGNVLFTFKVTNTSSEPVTIASLSDSDFDLMGSEGCEVGTILPVDGYCQFSQLEAISGDASGPDHSNIFTATATDNEGNVASDSDDAMVDFTDVPPDISITKTADPTSVPETGGDVTFTFVVSNDGIEDVTLTSLSDSRFGNLNGQGTCATGGVIPVGGSYTCEITEFLSSDSLTPHTNVVTAVGTDNDGSTDEATDDETVTFEDVLPTIQIVKTADPTYVPETGSDVTFTFLIQNTGAEDVTLTSLEDTAFGDLDGKGTCVTGGLILAGGSYSCQYTVFLSSDSLAPHINTATAVGTDDDGQTDTAWDDETVTFYDVAPMIDITKTANPTHVPETGGDVTFTFLVENTGVEDVTLTSLVDTVFGDLNGQGTCVTGGVIPVGGSYTCEYTVFLFSDSLTPHTNEVTAVGTDDDGTTDEATDNETVTFDDVAPIIRLTKTAIPAHVDEPGENVTFTFLVENIGPEDVTLTALSDTIYGDLDDQGDCKLPQTLLIGGDYSCSFTVYVGGEAGDVHSNVATATAVDDDGTPASDDDEATVTIDDVSSVIEVLKTATPDHVDEPGGNVTFDLVINNLSTVDAVTIDSLVDTIYGDLDGQGTCDVPQTIPVGGSYSCSFTVYVGGNADEVQYNVVTASGVDDDGMPVSDSDDAMVTFDDVPSAIEVLKTATPDHVDEPGGDVTFSFVVNNLSAVDAVTINSLLDTIYGNLHGRGNCAVPQTIPAGESYSCSFMVYVGGQPGDVHTNVVTASGVDDDGNPVSDTDDATVAIDDVPSAIAVLKTATPDHVDEPGGDVTFEFVVNNLSAVDTVTIDSLVDSIYGDLDGQGTCELPQTIPAGGSYSCSFVVYVGGEPGDVHNNVVTASGVDDDGNPVSDDDDATVTIDDVPSAIAVVKTATPDHVDEPGGDVTFDFVVYNLSAVDAVTIGSLVDSIYGDLDGQGTCELPQTIPAGGTYECSFTATVSGNAGDVHTNVVTATGVDDDGNPVSDDDDATVTIDDVSSAIEVVKTATPDHVNEPGGDVAFDFVITNLSAVDTVTIDSLVDSVYGNLDGQGTCELPQTIPAGGSYSCSFTVYVGGEPGDVHTNVVTATGTDEDGTPVSDTDDATVTIARNPGWIKIIKHANSTNSWDFLGDLGEFTLAGGESKTFYDLSAGNYSVVEDSRSFPDSYWTLTGVVCQVEGGGKFHPAIFDGGDVFYFIGVQIPLEAGQHITCTFVNERADVED